MKIFALLATSLALLSAGAMAQETATQTLDVKVTAGKIARFYPISPKNAKLVIDCNGTVIYNDAKDESQFQGKILIKYGDSFQAFAEKALFKSSTCEFYILLQSDGKIESGEGERKETQFVASGTRIELPSIKGAKINVPSIE